LVVGGPLPPETKKPPNRGGLMIPFAIFDLMVPSGLALAPFGKGCRAVIEPDLIVPLFMIICKNNYIKIDSEVNLFDLF
jgi:hypothetical protein